MAGLALQLLLVTFLWLLGWLFGMPFAGLVVGLLSVVLWQYSQQLRLVKWVRDGAKKYTAGNILTT